MKRHIITDAELNDYKFEHDIASATCVHTPVRKRLYVHVNPAHAHMHFTVMSGNLVMLQCGTLSEAIRAYNELG